MNFISIPLLLPSFSSSWILFPFLLSQEQENKLTHSLQQNARFCAKLTEAFIPPLTTRLSAEQCIACDCDCTSPCPTCLGCKKCGDGFVSLHSHCRKGLSTLEVVLGVFVGLLLCCIPLGYIFWRHCGLKLDAYVPKQDAWRAMVAQLQAAGVDIPAAALIPPPGV